LAPERLGGRGSRDRSDRDGGNRTFNLSKWTGPRDKGKAVTFACQKEGRGGGGNTISQLRLPKKKKRKQSSITTAKKQKKKAIAGKKKHKQHKRGVCPRSQGGGTESLAWEREKGVIGAQYQRSGGERDSRLRKEGGEIMNLAFAKGEEGEVGTLHLSLSGEQKKNNQTPLGNVPNQLNRTHNPLGGEDKREPAAAKPQGKGFQRSGGQKKLMAPTAPNGNKTVSGEIFLVRQREVNFQRKKRLKGRSAKGPTGKANPIKWTKKAHGTTENGFVALQKNRKKEREGGGFFQARKKHWKNHQKTKKGMPSPGDGGNAYAS